MVEAERAKYDLEFPAAVPIGAQAAALRRVFGHRHTKHVAASHLLYYNCDCCEQDVITFVK